MDLEALPDSIHQLVNDELAPGERVRWACQPRPRASLPWWSLAPFFVAVPWTLFTLFWMAGAAGLLDRGPGPIDITRLLLALFGVPFLLIGIAMFCSPLWVRHQRRRAASRTAYAITDRRAIVFDGGYYGDGGMASLLAGMMRIAGKGINVRSYTPDKLGKLERVQLDDGSGDVIFDEIVLHSQTSRDGRAVIRTGFFSVPDVKEVEQLLKSLAKSP
jgi:hypothetical protein